jgi:hypothetical protein
LEELGVTTPKSVRPSEIIWKSQPALPAGAESAVLLGDLTKPGEYVYRLRAPEHHRVMPHTHPGDRIYTVLEGIFYLGFGDTFGVGELGAFPAGSVILVPAGLSHFQFSKSGQYIVQINGIGPTATKYLRAEDDPRLASPPS